MTVALYRPARTIVPVAGQPVIAAYGPLVGGFIQNPFHAKDQGLAASEPLYIDLTGPAATQETSTTEAVQPGATFTIPSGLTGNVSVNAKTAGHSFSGVVIQSPTPFPPTPQSGSFPPSGPTVITSLATLAAYLYVQYRDDDDLSAFVGAYNSLAQGYLDWFTGTPLPVYTDPSITGALLDWVARGLYGMMRPVLSSGRNRDIGPLNTYAPNVLEPNRRKRIGPSNATATSDDAFKRILTWNLYRGDGKLFNVRWLKRRVKRFLVGANGTAPNVDESYEISVTYGPGIIAIRINVGTRIVTGGALANRFGCNKLTPNALFSRFLPGPTQFPLAGMLKEALESGFLQFPFQYQVTVAI